MNASMVRFGGIAIFVMFVLSLVGAFVVRGSATGGIILNLINTGLLLFAMWATKGFFNAKNYTRADMAIIVIIATMALATLVGIFTGTAGGLGMMSAGGGMRALGVVGIITMIITLVALVFMVIFALRCMDFGKSGGGGLWKAIGILYLIGLILIILTILIGIIAGLTKSIGILGLAGILIVVGMLVLLGAFICHGIGLIIGAGKMSA